PTSPFHHAWQRLDGEVGRNALSSRQLNQLNYGRTFGAKKRGKEGFAFCRAHSIEERKIHCLPYVYEASLAERPAFADRAGCVTSSRSRGRRQQSTVAAPSRTSTTWCARRSRARAKRSYCRSSPRSQDLWRRRLLSRRRYAQRVA